MAIFSNGIGTSIPEANFLKKLVAGSIVGERERDIDEGGHISIMHGSMQIITYSGEYGRFVVISIENLVCRVDEFVSVCKILLIF